MTTDQRKRLRMALEAHGFTRTSSSRDFGDGSYQEVWQLKRLLGAERVDQVTLLWAPKEAECDKPSAVLRSKVTCGEHEGHQGVHQRLSYGAWT